MSSARHGLPSPQRPGRADEVVLLPRLHAAHRRPAARTGPARPARRLRSQRMAAPAWAWPCAPASASSACSATRTRRCPHCWTLLAEQPTLLLLTAGARAGADRPQSGLSPSGLRTIALPWLTQDDYDRLLWASDINFVRGEDSLVRAHLGRCPVRLADLPAARRRPRRQAGGLPRPLPGAAAGWPDSGAAGTAWRQAASRCRTARRWRAACLAWRDALARQPDLVTALLAFAVEAPGAKGFAALWLARSRRSARRPMPAQSLKTNAP